MAQEAHTASDIHRPWETAPGVLYTTIYDSVGVRVSYMAGIGVWLEGGDTVVLPLILMGVEVDEGGAPTRDYYYTIWDHDEVEYYTDRLYTIMGWDINSTPLDDNALALAKHGAALLRQQYIKLWDSWYPTLYLYTHGCHPRRRMREKVRDMRLPPPFITRKPYVRNREL